MSYPLCEIIIRRDEKRLARSWKNCREIEVLCQQGVTQQEAAEALGVRKNTIWERVQRYGVKFPKMRGPYRKAA